MLFLHIPVFLRISLATLAIAAIPLQAAKDRAIRFDSGDRHVSLVELYTSEGCSSCPPADRWVSRLNDHSGLWTRFIPIVFHVDYWNYLGWTDRFSRAEYTQRQRNYAAEWNARTIYTPGFALNGEEWRGWRRGQNTGLLSEKPPAGRLTAERIRDRTFRLTFTASADFALNRLTFSGVLLGHKLESKVTRGENRGRTLRHEFTVLSTATTEGASSLNQGATWTATLELPDHAPDAIPTSLSAAFWVSTNRSQKPLQAVGGVL